MKPGITGGTELHAAGPKANWLVQPPRKNGSHSHLPTNTAPAAPVATIGAVTHPMPANNCPIPADATRSIDAGMARRSVSLWSHGQKAENREAERREFHQPCGVGAGCP